MSHLAAVPLTFVRGPVVQSGPARFLVKEEITGSNPVGTANLRQGFGWQASGIS